MKLIHVEDGGELEGNIRTVVGIEGYQNITINECPKCRRTWNSLSTIRQDVEQGKLKYIKGDEL